MHFLSLTPPPKLWPVFGDQFEPQAKAVSQSVRATAHRPRQFHDQLEPPKLWPVFGDQLEPQGQAKAISRSIRATQSVACFWQSVRDQLGPQAKAISQSLRATGQGNFTIN